MAGIAESRRDTHSKRLRWADWVIPEQASGTRRSIRLPNPGSQLQLHRQSKWAEWHILNHRAVRLRFRGYSLWRHNQNKCNGYRGNQPGRRPPPARLACSSRAHTEEALAADRHARRGLRAAAYLRDLAETTRR